VLLIFRILRKDKNQSTDEVSARKYRKTVAGMERKKLAKKKISRKYFLGFLRVVTCLSLLYANLLDWNDGNESKP
jgi:hypothetical protein